MYGQTRKQPLWGQVWIDLQATTYFATVACVCECVCAAGYTGFTFGITSWRTRFRKDMNKAEVRCRLHLCFAHCMHYLLAHTFQKGHEHLCFAHCMHDLLAYTFQKGHEHLCFAFCWLDLLAHTFQKGHEHLCFAHCCMISWHTRF